MKIRLSTALRQMASAITIVMVLGSILCLFVLYYLALLQQQNTLSTRSQAWNIAIAVTEAGIEDALQQLNSANPTPQASDGWTGTGTVYYRTNTLPNGNWYTVSIDLTAPSVPVVTSRAYIVLPILAAGPGQTFFASVGTGGSSTPLVSRAVRVTCSKSASSLFTAAMVSKHAIDLKGNGVLTDSFDSSNPARSTSGRYDPAVYAGDFGDVATDDSVIVGVQNANIYGHLHTGPTGGYSMGPQGGVGTHSWQGANGGGLQPGYFLQDANFTFPDTTLPNTAGYLTPQPGNVTVTVYNITSNSTTTTSYPTPAPSGGVTTNTASYTTVSTYPSPVPPGLTTNTTAVTTSSYPSPAPAAGVTTNITDYTTVASQPSPIPMGLVTNTIWVNNAGSLPSPAPTGSTTNTTLTSSKTYPSAGTYVGNVSTNIVSSGPPSGRGTWYNYYQITSYNYPTYAYTYPSSFTYTYPTYTYTYPNYNYTYNQYSTNSVVVTNHYDNILFANNNYVSTALNGSTIVMGQNVKLVLPNGLSGSENLFFNYTSPLDYTTAGLTIYAGGTSASISGNQYINPTGFAGSLVVYCAPTVTSFTLNGNGQFTGVLVAPNADVAMHGGGNSNEDFCGSLMVNSVSLNGHFSFHWDESLGRMKSNNNARYLVTSWNEIP